METIWKQVKGLEYRKPGDNVTLFVSACKRDQDTVFMGGAPGHYSTSNYSSYKNIIERQGPYNLHSLSHSSF